MRFDLLYEKYSLKKGILIYLLANLKCGDGRLDIIYILSLFYIVTELQKQASATGNLTPHRNIINSPPHQYNTNAIAKDTW